MVLDLVANFNLIVGPFSFKGLKGFGDFGFLIFVIGVILLFSLLFSNYIGAVLADILLKIGVILMVIGGLIIRYSQQNVHSRQSTSNKK